MMSSSRPVLCAGVTRRDLLVAAALAIGKGRVGYAADSREEVVDIHTHIASPDTRRYPPAQIPGSQPEWVRGRPQTFEEYVAQADAAGVSKAALVQLALHYGDDNSYVADSVARNGKRFVGVCSIDTTAPDAVQKLDGWLRRGFSGLRIYTTRDAGNVDLLVDSRAAPVWQRAQEKNLTVCLSTQAAGLVHVRTLLQRYPGVKVVLEHLDFISVADGQPFHEAEPFFDVAKFQNCYLNITPVTFAFLRANGTKVEEFLPKLVDTFGANRIAFGSNRPSSPGSLAAIVAEARSYLAALSSSDRVAIFSGTAKQLYPTLA